MPWCVVSIRINTQEFSPRQTLPLFTSLLNIIFSYDPVGYLPYNYLLFNDTREALVEVAAQVLCITLDNNPLSVSHDSAPASPTMSISMQEHSPNLFINYLSRIHRDEVRGIFSRAGNEVSVDPFTRISTWFSKDFADYWPIRWFRRIFQVHAKRSASIKNCWFCFGSVAIGTRCDASVSLAPQDFSVVFRNFFTTSSNPVKFWTLSFRSFTFSTTLDRIHVTSICVLRLSAAFSSIFAFQLASVWCI